MLQKEFTVSGFYYFKSYAYYSKTFKCWHLYQKYQSADISRERMVTSEYLPLKRKKRKIYQTYCFLPFFQKYPLLGNLPFRVQQDLMGESGKGNCTQRSDNSIASM
jgi:hypothetical protein